MFNNIRNKLKTVVQDSISSISLTSTADQSINQSSDKFDDVNYFAGCKLLEKYQNDWESMHNLTEVIYLYYHLLLFSISTKPASHLV